MGDFRGRRPGKRSFGRGGGCWHGMGWDWMGRRVWMSSICAREMDGG